MCAVIRTIGDNADNADNSVKNLIAFDHSASSLSCFRYFIAILLNIFLGLTVHFLTLTKT